MLITSKAQYIQANAEEKKIGSAVAPNTSPSGQEQPMQKIHSTLELHPDGNLLVTAALQQHPAPQVFLSTTAECQREVSLPAGKIS